VCPWDVITMVPTEKVIQEPKFRELLGAKA
jgi:hypothetical protein